MVLAYWKFVEGYYREDGTPTHEACNLKLAPADPETVHVHTLAQDFGPLALKTIRQGWMDAEPARTEINKRVGRVVRCFRWAVENELVAASVHQALKAVAGHRMGRSPARESKPVRPVADDLVDAVQPFVTRPVWTMIELQRLSGMRSGEVVLMRTGDIDRTGDVWVYTPATHRPRVRRPLRSLRRCHQIGPGP